MCRSRRTLRRILGATKCCLKVTFVSCTLATLPLPIAYCLIALANKRYSLLYSGEMKRLLLILTIVTLIPLTTNAQDIPAAVQFQQAHELLNQADRKRDNNANTEAISLYSEAQAMYRTLSHKYPNWQVNIVRFRATYCNTQIEAILKDLSKNTIKNSNSSTPLKNTIARPEDNQQIQDAINNAKALLAKGKHVKARMFLLQAMNLNPDDNTVRFLLGIAQCQAGKYKDAVYILEELIKENSANAKAYTVLGSAHFALGETAKAKSATAQALKLNPNLKEANFNMAQLLAVSNPPDKDRAKKFYKKALSLGAIRNASLELSMK